MMIRSTPGADELLDVRALLERVVLGVLEDDLQFGMLLRGGFRMSAFICTRQGSPRLHWLMPMV